jgi:hypothetical protein
LSGLPRESGAVSTVFAIGHAPRSVGPVKHDLQVTKLLSRLQVPSVQLVARQAEIRTGSLDDAPTALMPSHEIRVCFQHLQATDLALYK